MPVTTKDEKALLSDVVNAFSITIIEICRAFWEQQKIQPQQFVDKLTQAIDEMPDDANNETTKHILRNISKGLSGAPLAPIQFR
ncbi:MAG TPA: hypothetical protein VIW47_00015 [Nitrospiraceae bacterium]|jgi:hypothetical protein